MKRLYDDLLSNYNRLIRPVTNVTDILTVRLGLKLSQLMEVNLKNQVMTTNLWVEQVSSAFMKILTLVLKKGWMECVKVDLCRQDVIDERTGDRAQWKRLTWCAEPT